MRHKKMKIFYAYQQLQMTKKTQKLNEEQQKKSLCVLRF